MITYLIRVSTLILLVVIGWMIYARTPIEPMKLCHWKQVYCASLLLVGALPQIVLADAFMGKAIVLRRNDSTVGREMEIIYDDSALNAFIVSVVRPRYGERSSALGCKTYRQSPNLTKFHYILNRHLGFQLCNLVNPDTKVSIWYFDIHVTILNSMI